MVIWAYFIAVLSLNWLYENRNPDKYYPENILDLALLTYMFMAMMNRHIAVPIIEFGCNEIRYNLMSREWSSSNGQLLYWLNVANPYLAPRLYNFYERPVCL